MKTTGDKSQANSVGCVIPAYNAEATIGRALLSVLRTPGITEVIVVDDGSQDNTPVVVEELILGAELPVTLIRQENAGPGAARNKGIDALDSEWVTFLDADDEMLPDSVSSKAAFLAECPEPDSVCAVYGSFIRSDNGQSGNFTLTRKRVNRDGIGRPGGFPGGVVCYVFRREALLAAGGFRTDLRLFEDFELILRLIARDARIVGCDHPCFYRHYTPGSLSRGTVLRERLRSERHFFRIARSGRLLGRIEITRRWLRSRMRQIYFSVMRR